MTYTYSDYREDVAKYIAYPYFFAPHIDEKHGEVLVLMQSPYGAERIASFPFGSDEQEEIASKLANNLAKKLNDALGKTKIISLLEPDFASDIKNVEYIK